MSDDLAPLTIYLQKLEAVFSDATMTRMFEFIGERVGDAAEERGIMYPPSPGGRAQPFKTDKQRRYFFYALRNGIIKVPYTRTGNLGRALTHKVMASAVGCTITLGTASNVEKYAHWVVGDDQSKYHEATGWKMLQDDINTGESDFISEAQHAQDDFIATLGI